MRKMLLVFSHQLTKDQMEDAFHTYGVGEFTYLPDDLKKVWASIPPEAESIRFCVEKIAEWIKQNSRKGDYVLLQGDFGATFLLVDFCFESGLIPVYSTTARDADERTFTDGTVKVHRTFKHVRFRKYERWK
ncbi:CRISPR-associated protein Csx20 [Thermoanaerobacterium thermosulfurigenes]|uniref:CRISPR-associated protein Csx20 n=1 Tax=Thermoanaerobacterium thermosulfurigenes TaxID=33950 RepID=UPI003EF7F955